MHAFPLLPFLPATDFCCWFFYFVQGVDLSSGHIVQLRRMREEGFAEDFIFLGYGVCDSYGEGVFKGSLQLSTIFK